MPTGQANRLMPTLRRVVLARQSAARSDGELLSAFVNERDADAFAELVRRHGPMVLGVCRRLVGDHATADDSFQAVFLVLARRAASVRPREQVGNWLYGVAYRTALKARMVLARRRSREKQVDVMPEPTAPAGPTAAWSDVQPVIDEELARLPDKLRLPVVLCDLEGRPQREVAKQLNVPAATLATRLATARRTLAQRLTRRGVALSGGALAGLLGAHASASAVPPLLASGAARAGEAVAAGTCVNSIVSAKAIQLSEGVLRMMMLAKLKAVAVLAVTAVALTTGLGLGLMPAVAGDQPAPGPAATPAAKAAPKARAAGSTIDEHIVARLAADGVPEPNADDATFLRRLCLDVRGTPPTPVETWFFVSDQDADKRAKVVEWIGDDEKVKVVLAKKLGIPPEKIQIVRVKLSKDGKIELVLDEPQKRKVAVTYSVITDGSVRGVTANTQADSTWLRVAAAPTVEANRLAFWASDSDQKPTTVWRRQGLPWQNYNTLNTTVGQSFSNVPAQPIQLLGSVQYASPNLVLNERNFDLFVVNDLLVNVLDSDAEFLKKVLTDARGSGPTALELKYFTEDKDPKKREKLIDELLKDAAVQKKLGAEWKKKMLEPGQSGIQAPGNGYFLMVPDFPYPLQQWQGNLTFPLQQWQGSLMVNPSAPPAPKVDKSEKLVGELIAAQKSDEAILEALTLAGLGRLPTDSEKKLTLAGIASAKDRKAAWVAVAKALAGPAEAKKPAGSGK